MGKLKTTLFLTQIPLKEFFFLKAWEGRGKSSNWVSLFLFDHLVNFFLLTNFTTKCDYTGVKNSHQPLWNFCKVERL